MKPFTNFESRLVPLPDQQHRYRPDHPGALPEDHSKEGLDKQLFCDWRYDAQGNPKPDFILNQPRGKGAQILLAGDNFGCGSSREHAPWALTQFGFRAVISTSFADIFKQNSLSSSRREIHADLFANPTAPVKMDLAAQTLTLPERPRKVEFPVDAFAKHCLLEGIDELGYILQQGLAIAAFENQHQA
jgi:3-isopropylmalate/(R)-2-methylmalate dehydratase small subunit